MFPGALGICLKHRLRVDRLCAPGEPLRPHGEAQQEDSHQAQSQQAPHDNENPAKPLLLSRYGRGAGMHIRLSMLWLLVHNGGRWLRGRSLRSLLRSIGWLRWRHLWNRRRNRCLLWGGYAKRGPTIDTESAVPRPFFAAVPAKHHKPPEGSRFKPLCILYLKRRKEISGLASQTRRCRGH